MKKTKKIRLIALILLSTCGWFYSIGARSNNSPLTNSVKALQVNNNATDPSINIGNYLTKGSTTDISDSNRKSFAIISDLHFMDSSLLIQDGLAFQNYLNGDRKLLKESVSITSAVIDSLIKLRPKVVLIPGDLTKDGELASHITLANMLQKLVDTGIKVLVIPGNHDINNPHANSYNGDFANRVPSISYSQFDSIYQNMGFGQSILKDQHSLSYVSEPIPGIRILAIDATKSDSNSFIHNTCITSGKIKAATLAWAKAQIIEAQQSGKQIFAMMHHGIVEHYSGQSVIFGEYLIDDYLSVGEELMNAGLQVLFSGHYHANDIASREKNGRILTDIQTGSTVTAPCPFRLIHLQKDSMHIETKYIHHINVEFPDSSTFEQYSKEFLLNGLKIVAANMLPTMGIPNNTPGFSMLCDFIAETFAAHYAGDETINATQSATLQTIQSLLSSTSIQTQQLFAIVANMWNDLLPMDLNIQHYLTQPNISSPDDTLAYWIDEDFNAVNFTSSSLNTNEYILNITHTPTLPQNINLTTYYANIEKTTSKCAGNSIRIRAQEDGGYAEFTVPNAKTVEIYVKAKGNAASPRSAQIYRNNELVGLLEGIHTDSCALFSETTNMSTPVTYKIMSGSANPIMLSSIRVRKANTDSVISRPQIALSKTTTPYLKPPVVSGVIDDESDPASKFGINFIVKPSSPNSDYTIEVKSSNQNVVANQNIKVSGSDTIKNIKIIPNGVGYSKITVSIKEIKDSASYIINYGASAKANTSNTTWHTAIADASTAIAISDSTFVVADDETNILKMYHRQQSGLSIYEYDASQIANVTSSNPEMDIEASARGIQYVNRLYWLASLGNNKSGGLRPNRNRVFSTDITTTNGQYELIGKHSFGGLREIIVAWGDLQGWNFTASTASGMIPKRIDGFNVEGLAFAPDSTTAYIGLRAPLVPKRGNTLSNSNREMAVIIPCKNFERSMNDGNMSTLQLDSAILLDLNGRSIRSIDQISKNKYLIVAGMYDDNKSNAALYIWSGIRNELPLLLDSNLTANGEIHPEGILFSQATENSIYAELVSDNGTVDYYGDGAEAKTLNLNYRKFRKDVVTYDLCRSQHYYDTLYISPSALPISVHGQELMSEGDYEILLQDANKCDSIIHFTLKLILQNTANSTNIKIEISPNPATTHINIHCSEYVTSAKIDLLNSVGMIVLSRDNCNLSNYPIDVSNLSKGIYFVRVRSNSIEKIEKLIVK